MVKYNINDLKAVVFELKNNKSLIAPTDTVYGILSIDKTNIYKIKKRDRNKKVVLFIPNLSYVKNINENFIKLADAFWPGKLTLIKNKVSYRIPNNKFILELLQNTGPLFCSSANISGKPTINNHEEAIVNFKANKSDIIFLESNFSNGSPSTIYDVDKDKILREGDISYDQISRVIKQ